MPTTSKRGGKHTLTAFPPVHNFVSRELRREMWEVIHLPATSYQQLIDKLSARDKGALPPKERDWWTKTSREVQICLCYGWAFGWAEPANPPPRAHIGIRVDRRDQCLFRAAIDAGYRISLRQRAGVKPTSPQPTSGPTTG